MARFFIIACALIIFLTYAQFVSSSTSICRDWDSYKDQKCLKIINSTLLFNFDDAKKACEAEPGASLVTIHSLEEQEFITNSMFKEKKIPDGIWIGLRKDNNTFKWNDSKTLDFQNWDSDSPSNTPLEDCVQMSPGNSKLGKWSDELCTKRNLALCQRSPDLSLIRLTKLLDAVKDINLSTLKKLANYKLEMRYNYSTDIFKDESLYLKTFNDTDGKHSALIFPLVENKSTSFRNETINTCGKFNSTLVEIKSWYKQNIVSSFLAEIRASTNVGNIDFVHLNGHQVSEKKFNWLRSNSEFSYTNWYNGYPNAYEYVGMTLPTDRDFGKWITLTQDSQANVFCEFSIND